jgi:hypothetical protein
VPRVHAVWPYDQEVRRVVERTPSRHARAVRPCPTGPTV